MIYENVVFRAARPGDGPHIARLCAAVQSARTLPVTVWSSAKAHVWVEDLIAGTDRELGIEYSVVQSETEVEAAMCVRPVDDCVFVDNVYVAPRLRRLQVGAPFIRWAAENFNRSRKFSCVAWDVWEHEKALIAWYRQLGGVEQFRRNWVGIEPCNGPGNAEVRDVEEALARHQRYGFSSIIVETQQQSYRVGLLADHAFRITDPNGIRDPELMAALARLDPARKAWFLCPPDRTSSDMKVLATNLRLHAPYETFVSALHRYSPRRPGSLWTASC